MHRPYMIWPLLCSLLFLALGGLYGGIAMLADPSGNLLRLTEILPLLPVSDYVLPGLFLLFVMGLFPLILIYNLFTRPEWDWAERLFKWSRHYWAWTGTLVLGALVIIWLFVQGLMIGFKWPIQYITAGTGCLIVLLSFLPKVRGFYTVQA